MTTAPVLPRSSTVAVRAELEATSRWLWLVKWLLLIPHLVVLAVLWIVYPLVGLVALIAILCTARYPRPLFDFTAGVLRWSWRVHYYGYAALATDRYPPFTLADVPDYPARFDVVYPERLSRGLVLVKWWLLVLPHYVVVSLFIGGGTWSLWNPEIARFWVTSGGVVGILVFIAAVVLLFTGRYPRSIFDFVIGMDRWVLRVAAYASLLTDEYPPFQLDLGGAEPPSANAPGTGRAVPDALGALVGGVLIAVVAAGLLAIGAIMLWTGLLLAGGISALAGLIAVGGAIVLIVVSQHNTAVPR